MLRELVSEGAPVRLTGQSKPPVGPAVDYEVTVSRLGNDNRNDDDDGIRFLSDFVVTVNEREQVRADVTDWALRLKGTQVPIGNLTDLRVLLRDTISALQHEDRIRQTRPVLLELPDKLPAIRVDDGFADALKDLLREATLAAGDEPLRIVVETERDQMTLHIIDPQAILPGREVAAVQDAG